MNMRYLHFLLVSIALHSVTSIDTSKRRNLQELFLYQTNTPTDYRRELHHHRGSNGGSGGSGSGSSGSGSSGGSSSGGSGGSSGGGSSGGGSSSGGSSGGGSSSGGSSGGGSSSGSSGSGSGGGTTSGPGRRQSTTFQVISTPLGMTIVSLGVVFMFVAAMLAVGCCAIGGTCMNFADFLWYGSTRDREQSPTDYQLETMA